MVGRVLYAQCGTSGGNLVSFEGRHARRAGVDRVGVPGLNQGPICTGGSIVESVFYPVHRQCVPCLPPRNESYESHTRGARRPRGDPHTRMRAALCSMLLFAHVSGHAILTVPTPRTGISGGATAASGNGAGVHTVAPHHSSAARPGPGTPQRPGEAGHRPAAAPAEALACPTSVRPPGTGTKLAPSLTLALALNLTLTLTRHRDQACAVRLGGHVRRGVRRRRQQ